jgi:hypothetical protein
MATNIINIGFKGVYPSTAADRTGYISNGDNNDIFHFLGTNFGNQTWSNPVLGSYLDITSDLGSPSGVWEEELVRETPQLNFNPPYLGTNGNSLRVTASFTNLKVRPTFSQIVIYTGLVTYSDISIQGSNDNTNWESISGSITGNFGDVVQYFTIPDIASTRYYSYIRLTITGNNNNTRLKAWKLYGRLSRTDKEAASFTAPINTLEQLPNYLPDDLHNGDLLYYSGGIITNKRRKLYETKRLIMTGNLTINPTFFPNFYILDPNGASRNVDLPTTPLDEMFLRFKTLDPSNTINIRESGPTTIATLSTSTPVVDLYYSNSAWTVLSYG